MQNDVVVVRIVLMPVAAPVGRFGVYFDVSCPQCIINFDGAIEEIGTAVKILLAGMLNETSMIDLKHTRE